MHNNCELDVLTVEVLHTVTDVYLPSLVSVSLMRRYVSTSNVAGILGWGWTHNYTASVSLTQDSLTQHNEIDGDKHFALSSCDGEAGPACRIVRRGTRSDEDPNSLHLTTRHPDVRSLS